MALFEEIKNLTVSDKEDCYELSFASNPMQYKSLLNRNQTLLYD